MTWAFVWNVFVEQVLLAPLCAVDSGLGTRIGLRVMMLLTGCRWAVWQSVQPSDGGDRHLAVALTERRVAALAFIPSAAVFVSQGSHAIVLMRHADARTATELASKLWPGTYQVALWDPRHGLQTLDDLAGDGWVDLRRRP